MSDLRNRTFKIYEFDKKKKQVVVTGTYKTKPIDDEAFDKLIAKEMSLKSKRFGYVFEVVR